MSKQIITSVLVSEKFIKISATNKTDNDLVCIYNQKRSLNNLDEGKVFLDESIKEISKITNSKVQDINLIFDDFSLSNNYLNAQIKVLNKTFKNFKKSLVVLNEANYWEFQSSIKKEIEINIENASMKLIQLTPLKFTIKSNSNLETNNTFSEFPIGKQVSEISCYFCAVFISNKSFDKIIEVFDWLDIRFNNITFLSQLSPYKFRGNISDKLTFTFDIEEKKSILVTSINKIVVATNELRFSFNDLVNKISKDFNISEKIAINLIKTKCKNIAKNDESLDEIIHLTNDDQSITRKNLVNTIKSFLKTLSTEIYQIIDNKSNIDMDYDINIVGKLEKLEDVDLYCSKYLKTQNVMSNKHSFENFMDWNKKNRTIMNLNKFINVVDEKIKSNTLNNKNNKKQTIEKERKILLKQLKRRNQKVVLA